MYVEHLCKQFILHWDEESLKHNFCLRFPNGFDFISFLHTQNEAKVQLLLANTHGLELLETSFNRYFSHYIKDLRDNLTQCVA